MTHTEDEARWLEGMEEEHRMYQDLKRYEETLEAIRKHCDDADAFGDEIDTTEIRRILDEFGHRASTWEDDSELF